MSKNLHDLSDEEFDDLFRDSAEKNDIGFDPEAWNKMSKKLDAAAPPSSPGKGGSPLSKWILPALIVLLLLITGTYLVLRKPSEAIGETKGKEKESSLKQEDKVDKKYVATDKVGTENQNNAKETSVSDNKIKASTENISNDKASANELLNADKPKSGKAEKSDISISKQNKRNEKEISATEAPKERQGKAGNSQIQQKTAIVASERKAISDIKANTAAKSSDVVIPKSEANTVAAGDKIVNHSSNRIENKADNTSKIAKITKPLSVLKDNEPANSQTSSAKADDSNSIKPVDGNLKTTVPSQSLVGDSANTIEKMQWASLHTLVQTPYLSAIHLKLPEIDFDSPFLTPTSKPRENTAFRRGLNIRLALSPDFSFIPSNTFFKVGNNWAAIIEYRINNRLSIQSGVIRSMKLYSALPSQYEWNSYWTMPSPLKDIDATCKMLDIPLNVRYDITQKANSRLFVGAGFTSYIMLKEEYLYNYENPADPNIKRRSWEGKTGAYPFSVLNLSAGYERQIFRRLTFQAEPFFKAPLGKVGYGKVRLATAGVFFSVKYPF